jgi:biopolymer transport protein ExbD
MKLPSPIRRKHVRIEIIPLIDIMFFLLASFMMVSLQLDQARNIKVNLPPSTEAQHDFKPDMINIAVDKTGAVWLEKKKITLADLGQAVSRRFLANTNLPVYISGDQDTLHGAMVDVLQAVRNAGVQKVGFMVGGQPTEPVAIAP